MTSRLSAVLFFQRKCFSILPWVCAATERKIRSVVKVVSEIYIFKLPVSKEDSLGLEHTKSNFGVVRSCLTNFCNDFFSGYCPDIVRVVTEKSGPYVKQFRRYEISNFHCPKKAVWAQKTLSGILVHYGPVVQLLVLSFFLVLHWYNKSLKKTIRSVLLVVLQIRIFTLPTVFKKRGFNLSGQRNFQSTTKHLVLRLEP